MNIDWLSAIIGAATLALIQTITCFAYKPVRKWLDRRDPQYIWRDHCGDECQIGRS